MKHLHGETLSAFVFSETQRLKGEIFPSAVPQLLPPSFDAGFHERSVQFAQLVFSWNDRVDLVSRSTMDEIVSRHVVDSLGLAILIAPRLESGHQELFDIGSGGGFPGIVIALAIPSCRVTLVEPRKKRCVFLNEARRRLQLKNLAVFEGSFAQLASTHPPSAAPIFTVRGLTPDRDFMECASQMAGPSGSYVAYYLTGEVVSGPEGVTAKALFGGLEMVSFQAVNGMERRIFHWSG